MGDGLHTQLNALDSGCVTWDVTRDYSDPANQPVRWLAEGRDASATLDGSATPTGFGKNDGDNEITGIYVSDGDPSADGILGDEVPGPERTRKWRWFYTQQHGDNVTYEVLVRSTRRSTGTSAPLSASAHESGPGRLSARAPPSLLLRARCALLLHLRRAEG